MQHSHRSAFKSSSVQRALTASSAQQTTNNRHPLYQGIMQMQQTLGNKAVGRLLASGQPDRPAINPLGGIMQRKLEPMDNEGHYYDSRDQWEDKLIFEQKFSAVYMETTTGNFYYYYPYTDQFVDMQGLYFDPYYRAYFSPTENEGYYYNSSGLLYYYFDGYYYPYQQDQMPSGVSEEQQKIKKDQAIDWLKNQSIGESKMMAELFIDSYRFTMTSKAREVIDNWNTVFPDKAFDLDDKKYSSLYKNMSDEDSSIVETVENKSGLSGKTTKQRDALGSRTSFSIGKKGQYECELSSTEGGYHNIYKIIDSRQVLKGINNSDLLIRVPINPYKNSVSQGISVYRNVKESVNVPMIYNDSIDDGFYLVEKIPHECDPSEWGGNKKWDDLLDSQIKRLKQIKVALEGVVDQIWYNGGKEPIPDFRPANVRFRDGDELVLIDFSEESEQYNHENKDDMFYFAEKLRENINQFAGLIREKGLKANPEVIEYLTENFPKDLVYLMKL